MPFFKQYHYKVTAMLLISVVVFFSQCTYDGLEDRDNDHIITLRWVKAYLAEEWNNVRTGLIWSFSDMGATLPAGSFDASITWKSDQVFKCDLSKLGFSEPALNALAVIVNRLKSSGEYHERGGIDIGRFLMLTLYSPAHYYKISGVPASLNAFKQQHAFNSSFLFPVNNSCIALHERMVEINNTADADNVLFIGTEGTGSVADSTFAASEFETIDVMPNSQLRFAIYNRQGNLVSSANSAVSSAGKIGKCLWCHESNLNPLFYPNDHVAGYITPQEFTDTIFHFRNMIEEKRNTLSTDVIYANLQDHTQSELLYISFNEPSAERLANEWMVTVAEAKEKMKYFATHTYPEFPFLGDLYYRSWADSLAPYGILKTPDSARETSEYEPNFF